MYWIFASFLMFIIFLAWTSYESEKAKKKGEKNEQSFWEREAKANATRRKPIDHLDYIQIPDNLPYDLCTENQEISACLMVIKGLKDAKILNLSGFSNTDLKIKYGAPNITRLSEYDQNYTSLVTTLQKWADELIKLGYENEAITIMEFSISTGTDVGKTYRLLGARYVKSGQIDKLEELTTKAQAIRTLNGKFIVQTLQELNPYNG